MKLIKKLFLSVLLLTMGFSSLQPIITQVSATEFIVEHNHDCVDCEESEILPLAVVCQCGGSMVYDKSYTDWEEEKRACKHGYLYGTDLYEYRTVTSVPECQDCGMQLGAATTSRQSRYVSCSGYN